MLIPWSDVVLEQSAAGVYYELAAGTSVKLRVPLVSYAAIETARKYAKTVTVQGKAEKASSR